MSLATTYTPVNPNFEIPCASNAYRIHSFPKGHKHIINDCEIEIVMPDDSMVDSGIEQNDT